MNTSIRRVDALEILDSRGRPTVAAYLELEDGTSAQAHAPSGASTGRHEALELRDGDPSRYDGKGTRQAVAQVRDRIAPRIRGLDATNQAAVDGAIRELPGLGANATVAVSCAVARAAAASLKLPLWKYLAGSRPARLPRPMVNILSGGAHAERNIEFQDFLVYPDPAQEFAEQLEQIVAVHREAKLVIDRQGYPLTGVADEGGWGPRLESNEKAVQILTEAIARVNPRMTIALDVAATQFAHETAAMIDQLEAWCGRYPIESIEDGLAEDDWAGWKQLTDRLGKRVQLVGDDFFTTNLKRVERGIAEGCANAVLVKMNQIGTLTETFAVIDRARQAGWGAVISARSGETEDSFLADLAVASGAGQIKVGSITRSERLAKYNRLLEIAHGLS